jgi:flagellar motor switch protein FliN/FliY
MNQQREAVRLWFFDTLAAQVALVFEAMAGVRPEIRCEMLDAAPESQGLRWRQGFEGALGSAWICAAPKNWMEASQIISRAAGLEDEDEASLKSTWIEALGQALGGVAQAISKRVGSEVTPSAGEEASQNRGDAAWARLHLQFGASSLEVDAGAEIALQDGLLIGNRRAVETPNGLAAAAEAAGGSKTFELLLDVELPVSVSFGRAQVPLKDVIKLTTGSIVELNRSIAEPVEVIVNNCVIARGEVVVVEGNFGVRIREVISQKERLRTLN